MQLKQKQKIIGAVTLIGLLSFFLPTYFVHADGVLGSIISWTMPSVTDLLTYALQSVFIGISGLTAVLANALSLAVEVRAGGSIPVITATWTILRDFANMFFIIMLIYMAFATIFDQGKYTFKDMIVRFVLVAVLINFSLVIGNMVIDACQVLSNVFLGSIGNLGGRLGTVLNPAVLFNAGNGIGGIDFGAATFTSLLFAIILGLIFLFSIAVATAFSIIRIPMIWGLLIVSPLAWMSHILPGTNKWWSRWWSLFSGWNLFLPVYLFFMYIGLTFLSQRSQIINAVIQANSAGGINPANGPLLVGLNSGTNSLTFNLLFFYIFAAVVMVGGTWAAIETTKLMGSGFDKGVGWAKWAVKNFPTPYVGSLTNWQEATKQRRDQFKKEGAFGFFGTDKSDRDTASRARFLGVKSAEFKNAKEQVAGVEKEVTRLKDMEKAGQIQVNEAFKTQAAQTSNTSIRGMAMRSLLYERGMIDPTQFEKDMSSWVKTNPFLAQAMSSKAKKAKFKSVPATQLLEMASGQGRYSHYQLAQAIPMRKEWFDAVLEDDTAVDTMTPEQYATSVALYGGKDTKDGGDWRKKVVKKRPDIVISAENPPATRVQKLKEELGKMEPSDVAKLPLSVWGNVLLRSALTAHIDELQVEDPATPAKDGGKAYLGGGVKYKTSLRKAIQGKNKKDLDKLKELKKVSPDVNAYGDETIGEDKPAPADKKEEENKEAREEKKEAREEKKEKEEEDKK